MSEFHIGKLMKGLREDKRIGQKELYYGLRKETQIYQLENGELEPSKLLTDILFERMGVAPEEYGYVFSAKEYRRFEYRSELIERLKLEKWEEAEIMCQEYRNQTVKEGKWHEQFVRCVEIIISISRNELPDILAEKAKNALFLTVPGLRIEQLQNYLLGNMERLLLAVLASTLCKSEGEKEKGIELYRNLLFHMEEHCEEPPEQAGQIPPVVLLLAQTLAENGRYSELWICEKGIEILRICRRYTLLEPLMRLQIKGWKESGVLIQEGDCVKEWESGLMTLHKIEEEYRMKKLSMNLAITSYISMLEQNGGGQLLNVTLRQMREEKGMSIEELADGICDPANLKKIEMGIVNPRQKNYVQFMRKLGHQECRHHLLIRSDDYRMFECYQKIRYYLSQFEYEKAEHEFVRLKNGLDKMDPVNAQVLMKTRAILDEHMKRITAEEELQMLQEALAKTIDSKVNLKNWPLNQTEVAIRTNIAIVLEKMGKRNEGIEILMEEKNKYEQSGVSMRANQREYMMILYNLVGFLGREGKYLEALETVTYGIRLSLEWQLGYRIVEFLYAKAWNIEKMMKKNKESIIIIKNECLPIFKEAFHIALIMKYIYYKHLIQKHCKDYYGFELR